MIDEAQRVRDVYGRHSVRWGQPKYRGWMPGNLLSWQERERVMLDLLRRDGRLPMSDQQILEIGCAGGKTLVSFLRYGAEPANLFGVDLLPSEVDRARALAPHLHFEVADARALPFPAASFDLVVAFTILSSIPSSAARAAVAGEVHRVLRPTGAVLLYDFSVTSRVNRDTRPVRVAEIQRLFPGWHVEARRVTLAPPLARRLAPRSWLACELLAAVPGLRTHWLGLVRPEVPDRVRPGVARSSRFLPRSRNSRPGSRSTGG